MRVHAILTLFALATPFDASWMLVTSIGLVGMAQGAEGDIGGILASREFEMRHYSFIYSLLVTAIGVATAAGSVVLSMILARTGSYNSFLVLAGIVTLLGVICFYLIGRCGKGELPADEAAVQPI